MSAVLDAMARGNAFVQPVGQGWYRYHSWFRAVLHLKLRREKPQIVADLHLTAAGRAKEKRMLFAGALYTCKWDHPASAAGVMSARDPPPLPPLQRLSERPAA